MLISIHKKLPVLTLLNGLLVKTGCSGQTEFKFWIMIRKRKLTGKQLSVGATVTIPQSGKNVTRLLQLQHFTRNMKHCSKKIMTHEDSFLNGRLLIAWRRSQKVNGNFEVRYPVARFFENQLINPPLAAKVTGDQWLPAEVEIDNFG